MSLWTHVSGVIGFYGDIPTNLEDILGKQTIWEEIDSTEEWEERFEHYENTPDALPLGSEGSIQYSASPSYKGPKGKFYDTISHIVIWGNLRDFEDAAQIKRWWFNSLKRLEGARVVVDERSSLFIDSPFEYSMLTKYGVIKADRWTDNNTSSEEYVDDSDEEN